MLPMENPRLARAGNYAAKVAVGLEIVTTLVGLAFFALAGTYARFWADDYCYTATIKQFGLINGLLDWYAHSGNRVSTLFVVALADLFGWSMVRFIPTALLVFWVAAWYFFLDQLRRRVPVKIAWPWLALVSLTQVYFAVLLAPDRLQTFYWRMGTLHYTLPMPLLLVNLGLLLSAYRQNGKSILWMAAASGLLAFFAAGLSETFAALELGVMLTGALAAWVFLRGPQRGHVMRLLAAPLLGTLLMMIIMMRAPANAWREAALTPPDNLLKIIPYSLRYTADFIYYMIRGQVLPFFTLMLGMGALGILLVPVQAASMRRLLVGVGVTLLVTYAWVVCSFAPSGYAGLAYPAGRAQMPGSVILLAGLSTTALLLGAGLRQRVPQTGQAWLALAALVLLALVSLYPLRGVSSARRDIATMSVKAARWDGRHALILQAVAAGQMDVRVKELDVVQSLEDIGPHTEFWVNRCAAIAYGVHTIAANP